MNSDLPKIPFSPPRMDQKIIDAVVEVLKSGWITTGPKTKRFEIELAEYCGVPKVVCLGSATEGLELALRWFGVGPGDEVVLPAYTYSATANVVMHVGAKPVFVDVKEDDLNISVEAVKNAITERTKVIMPVDLAGMPCDYEAFNLLVKEKKIQAHFKPNHPNQLKLGRILLLSDAAHSFGAVYKNKKAGAFTDLTVFSFHAVKNLSTAEGGALSFNLPEDFNPEQLYQQFCISSLHGQNKDALAKSGGSWKYDIVEAGYKCNMTDIQAAMGLVELERYDRDMLIKRKQIFDFYTTYFSNFPWAVLPVYETDEKMSSYHVFMLRIKGIVEEKRDQIITSIMQEGVSVNVHFLPVPAMSFYKSLGYKVEDYPIAQAGYIHEVSLPVFYDLTTAQMERICKTVSGVVQSKL